MTYPEGLSPTNLQDGRWVLNGKGTKSWSPSGEDMQDRRDIAHFHRHGSPYCRQCVRGIRASDQSGVHDEDDPEMGRTIALKTNEN